jgi:inner membrane protein
MMASTHILTGIATFVVGRTVCPTYIPEITPLTMGCMVFGSLFPDIDHPQSYLGSRIWPISWLIKKGFKHRGATHSLLFTAFFGAAFFVLVQMIEGLSLAPLVCFVLGYLSHLFADSLTNSGVPLCWPIEKRFKVPLLRVETGGTGEFLIGIFVAGFILFQGYQSNLLGSADFLPKIWSLFSNGIFNG